MRFSLLYDNSLIEKIYLKTILYLILKMDLAAKKDLIFEIIERAQKYSASSKGEPPLSEIFKSFDFVMS